MLIPYLSWNLLYILYILLQKVAASCLNLNDKPVRSNISDFFKNNGYLHMLWDCQIWELVNANILGYNSLNSGPILIPMWFIRDLIIVVIISPIIFTALRKFKYWFIIALGICYITKIWPNIHGFSIDAIFFFSSGAYFSIYTKNMINH